MVWLIVGSIVAAVILIVVGMAIAVNQARTAYVESLEQLKKDPTNADLRQRTLHLGRKYIETAKRMGRAAVDELSIMNDINAACAAGAKTSEQIVKIRCRACNELNEESAKFCKS